MGAEYGDWRGRMRAIVNATLVFSDHYEPDGVLLMENKRIFAAGRKLSVPEGAEIIDAEGLFVGPGLIDIHTHGDGVRYFHEEPEGVSKTLLRHGVTSVLPALYYSLGREEHLSAIRRIHAAREHGDCPNVFGLYMEGPYLNPDFGCDREKNVWKGEIREEDYAEIVDAASDFAKVWCLSPEREGTRAFVEYVKKKIPSIVFSVAHSTARPHEIEALMPYGLRLATHHTNATGTIENYPECRGVCVDEAVNYNRDIYAEIICDSLGIHVDPYMIRLLLKIKGRDRIILISDAFVADGPPIPGCEEAFDINFDHQGEIAGSRLTLDVACQNMIKHTGGSVCDMFTYASRNPARLLGLDNVGTLRPGSLANVILVDHWFTVKKTILKGEVL